MQARVPILQSSALTAFDAGRTDFGLRAIDLGFEPAIESDGGRHTAHDRRNVSVRWLCGTILTGLAGACLIGASVFAALDRQSNFADQPEYSVAPRREAAGGDGVNERKGDRLVKAVDIVAAKQGFRAPTTIKIGDKEVIRTRGFVRVSTTLTQSSTAFADDVPAFNPLALIAGDRNAPEPPADLGPVQDDAEVSFVMKDLGNPDPGAARMLSLDEARGQIGELLRTIAAAGARPPLPLPPQLLLMRTSRAGLLASGAVPYAAVGTLSSASPFTSLNVRMVPENVTLTPRAPATARPLPAADRIAVVKRGEQLEDILRAAGAARDDIANIVAAFNTKRGDAPVREGQKIRFLLFDLDGEGAGPKIGRLSVYTDETLETLIARADSGRYVQIASTDVPVKAAKKPSSDDDEDEDAPGGMRLYNSFYETALKQEIPKPIIDTLVRVFANDVDFQRAVQPGDQFEAFYDDGEDSQGRAELLYASITSRNDTFRYFRFQTPDDNAVDFYDENGKSSRKFLIRKPIADGRLSSGFGMRYHPILGYSKMHTGTDWAAPVGTPILAAGNGTIIAAGWDSGYGRRVEIQHANGYITTYNHMSGFARSTAAGARVRQGQVIGYVGQTGQATGPHLHYEVLVNAHFVDAMRVKLARTREFDGGMLGAFRRERDRVESLRALAPNAPQVVAQKTN